MLRDVCCNVGLPPIITAQTISYVDLDLDVQFWPDGRYEVLDEDEFIEHTALFGYPEHVSRRHGRRLTISWRSGTRAPHLWIACLMGTNNGGGSQIMNLEV